MRQSRFYFSKSFLFSSLLAILLVVSTLSTAHAALRYVAGTHYDVLDSNIKPQEGANQAEADGKVEVIEFFSYGCPACNIVHQSMAMKKYENADNIVYQRVPVSFFPGWDEMAKAYYTAVELDVLDKVDGAIFRNHHERIRDMTQPQNVKAVFVEYGVDPDEFDDVYNSFALSRTMRDSERLLGEYKVYQTPFVIVDGRYSTDLAKAGNPQNFADITGFLVTMSELQRKD